MKLLKTSIFILFIMTNSSLLGAENYDKCTVFFSGLKSVEIKIVDTVRIAEIEEWLLKKEAFNVDFTKMGAVTPNCYIRFGNRDGDKLMGIFVCNQKERIRGTVTTEEFHELANIIGLNKVAVFFQVLLPKKNEPTSQP